MKIFKNNKRAFTIAEVLVTIAVLAVVATIAIPASVNNFSTKRHRTQLQKATETYESMLSLYRTDNRIGLNDIAGLDNHIGANCANIRRYFKIRENGATNCQFRTNDGIWFDFANGVTSVTVAFSRGDLNAANARMANNNSAFILNPVYGLSANVSKEARAEAFNNRTKIYNFTKKKQNNGENK